MIDLVTEKLVKSFEKLRLKSYHGAADPDGVYTIGWGHVITGHEIATHGIELFKRGDMMKDVTITEEQAEILFQGDIKIAMDGIRMRLDKQKASQLTEDQRGALVSLTFNIGLGGFGKSAVRATINMGDPKDAVHGFKSWISAGRDKKGNLIKVPGLIKRRAAEAALYQSDYEMVEYFIYDKYSKEQLYEEVIPRAKSYLDLDI